MSSTTLICQGAEARIFKSTMWDRPVLIKERFAKTYRHQILDKSLNTQRTKAEVKGLTRCSSIGIRTPTVYLVDKKQHRIVMEELDGMVVKKYIENVQNDAQLLQRLLLEMAEVIAKMHDCDIIHGDLTTSNMVLMEQATGSSRCIALIDFGLSSISTLHEDKSVDLYVLERAFLSTHPDAEQMFHYFVEHYRTCCKKGEQIVKKLDDVRARGRKRDMVG